MNEKTVLRNIFTQLLHGSAEILPILSALKEILVTAAATTGAIVALLGLNAWRRQLSGKTEYDVALRFLRAVYRLRDAIGLVRSPFMSAGEMAHAAKDKAHPPRPSEDSLLDATAAAYELRWKSVMEAMSDIQLVALEAEVLWGRNPVELLEPLRKCVGELHRALSTHLRSHTGDQEDRTYNIVFSIGDDPKENPFGAKLKDAVIKVENFVRPHLK